MAVKATVEVTLVDQTDMVGSVLWYQLSPSATKPAKPTTTDASATPSGWSKSEPGFDATATNYLYTCLQVVWGDGTCDWGDVQLSSAYESAKLAYNAAVAAGQSASAASEAASVAMHSVQPNLTPWFSSRSQSYWSAIGIVLTDSRWNWEAGTVSFSSSEGTKTATLLDNGWIRVTLDARASAGNNGTSTNYFNMRLKAGSLRDIVSPGGMYTYLIEVANLSFESGSAMYVCPSVANATNDVFSSVSEATGTFTEDEAKHVKVTAKADFSTLTGALDTRGYCYVKTGTCATFDLRISLYEGEYCGPYKPYVDPSLRQDVNAAQEAADAAQAAAETAVAVNVTAIDFEAGTATLAATCARSGSPVTPTAHKWTKDAATASVGNQATLAVTDLDACYHCAATVGGAAIVGSIDLKAVKAAHDHAMRTATNYLHFDQTNGLDVGYEGTGAKTRIDGSGVEVYDGSGQSAISAKVSGGASTVRVGRAAKSRVELSNGSILMYDDGDAKHFDVSDVTLSGSVLMTDYFLGNGSTKTFYLRATADSAAASDMLVFVNGGGTNAVTRTTTSVTFSTAPATGTDIRVNYHATNPKFKTYTLGNRKGTVGADSFVVGRECTASGTGSHAYGMGTVASAEFAHAEGFSTEASGRFSHAEGFSTEASGDFSKSQNHGTVAASDNQTAIGKYNKKDSNGKYAFIVGNGDYLTRSNALALTWAGYLATEHATDGFSRNSGNVSSVTQNFYRCLNVVQVRLAVTLSVAVSAGGSATLGTMSAGYRPVIGAGLQSNSVNRRAEVLSDGTVTLYSTTAISSGTTVTLYGTYIAPEQ